MTRDEIHERLSKGQADFPFPKGELKRLAARRWILNYLPRGGIGAEVGVFRGHFSELICRHAKPKKIYLIDPWTKVGEHFGWGGDYTLDGRLPTALARDEALLRTSLYPDVDVVVVEDSFPSCSSVIEEPLDWLYLDASHGYRKTLSELRAAASLLKPQGILLGDDWRANPAKESNKVREACHAFMRETDFDLIAAGPGAQWCMACSSRK